MTESELLAEVLGICEENKILAFHSGDPRRDYGRGFPDLVLCGRYRVLFCELKANGGTLRPEQTEWRYRLVANGAGWVCWTPRHLDSGVIESTLAAL